MNKEPDFQDKIDYLSRIAKSKSMDQYDKYMLKAILKDIKDFKYINEEANKLIENKKGL